MFLILVVASAFGILVGGIPFGFLLGRMLLKDDIRRHGSGNIGATNVGRVLGWKWGGLVLFLDAVKGAVPVILAMKIAPPDYQLHAGVTGGIAAVIGHMYPVYLKLRGGKGVATALGVVLVLAWKPVAAALLVFAATAWMTRIVSLASMLAAVTFSAAYLILSGSAAWSRTRWPLTAFAIAVPLLIIFRHRSNIARMLQGSEARVTDRPSDADSGDES